MLDKIQACLIFIMSQHEERMLSNFQDMIVNHKNKDIKRIPSNVLYKRNGDQIRDKKND